ncbi:SDR family NAD(P)-dependent oxidoreductase, partial [Burkholderia gladioli]|uniref:SDR family NAD(P)-dependent oxidoreductase n=1 Tax=Burkholderia gladioli TaxID=28095 RepID=UPI003F79FFA7
TLRRMAARLALALGEATPAAAAPAPATASAPAPASVPAQAPAGTRDLPAAPGPLPAAAPASATDHARPAAAPVQGTTTPHREHAPIAIIGIAGRYPGANGMDQYWDNLAAGRDSVEEIPPSRWNVADYYDADRRRPGKVYSKWLGRLDEMDCFDPLFFNISPAEAELMDPQQRLFLEESYRAFEDAGYDPRQLSEARCGVYLGIMGASEYGWLVQQHRGAGDITGTSAAIAAARIAYFLNLKGPAIPVDTACSSSLVATHLACQALRSGEIDLALAGGVTLYLSPEMYMSMCGAGMLSPDGRCKTLDNAADGFVPGEGVGTLVLKRLADAERDGDVIHGVIVGSGINQDGKTNGITAPNLASQIELEREVYARHAIDPDTIGCVELHGTGTKLGDPIELNALATVFREKTARRNYCALGSVKSNIGHTSAAAGVAGVHKVLLQMRHGQLAPTLHYRTPNEHFDFERSPFFVNTVLQPWPADDGRPRRAAVSSFGISGTNAHLVIEEYRPAVPRAGTAGPVLIVLSAKSAAQLRTQALQLRATLARDPAVGLDLASLAFTLQTGRAAFEQRIALVAESREHLVDTLDAWLREPKSAGVLSGEVRRTTEAASLFDGEAEFAELLASLVRNGKLRKLGELWVKGVAVDWSALYGAARPGRVSLPTYPFARERYWVAQDGSLAAPRPAAAATAAARMPADAAGQLHPLVHRNVSTFGRQRYRTVLRGDEFFLRDHLVSGRRVVPGVAQLEWARAAVADALADPAMTVRLEQVNWLRPLVAESALEVHVTLVPQQGGRIRFEIHSGSGEHARAHSQGFAVPVPLAGRAQPPRVDLAAWRARAAQPTEVAARYAHFERVGLRYGPSFRVMDQLRVGADHALAMLRWPAEAPAEGYAWPPSVLDGALQAGLGLVARDGGLELPFAMQAIEQWGPLPKNGISIVRRAADDSAAVRKLDVEIVDVDGRVAMRVSGFSTRPLGAPLAAGPLAPAAAPRQTAPAASIATASFASAAVPRRQPGELMLAPIWEAVEETPSQAVAGLPRTVWLGAETASLDRPGWVARLQAEGRLEQLVWQVPAGVARVALVGLRLIQALLELGYGAQTLKLTVVTRQAQAVSPTETADPEQAGVHGLVGSLAKSYPKWQVRLLDLPRDGELASLEWQRVPADPRGDARAWREGRWYRQRLAPCSLPAVEASRFRHGGVYVVLGGAGSIGAAFSEHLIRRYRAQLVWLGRRPEDEAIRTQLSRLAALGPAPLYLSADATDRQALERARATILARFGTVHGIVHSAVVLGEAPLAALDEAGFAEVLATKATTCEQMDAVFGGDALDFQLFFSSAQSFTKTPRLSHYSAGCCHTDAYAHNLRNRPYAVRVMHWGYWGLAGDGAARFDQLMAQSGFAPIDPARGMGALEQLLAGPLGQLAFLSTTHGEGARAALGVSERETVQGLPSTPAVTLPERAEAAAPVGAREMQRLFERHLAHIVWAQLAGAGWLERDDGLAGFYGRWRQAALRLLAEQGIRIGERVPAHDALWAEWRAFVAQTREDPMLGAQVRLADVTLHALPEVLRGQRKPTELLFPQGQLHLVQGIYRDNPVADYFNEALAESLDAYLRERLAQQPDAAIRILEIGAGTGGTSVRLFARLAAHAPRVAEYCYTDLSPAFLMHAERHYRDAAPYLRTARLDIEQAPAGQGFAAGAYDLVVAANVLHATRDIHRTLRHTKHLLKANGVLLLNEVSRPSLFTHVTFGLLDGWWLAEDAALRIPGTPALSADSWRSVLGAEGFAPVGFPARHAHELGQQIVAAVSDGVIRRRSEPVDEPVNGAVDKTVSERSPAPTSAPVSGLAPEPVPTPVPVPTAPSSGTPQAWQLAARAVIRESIGQALKLGESRLDDDEAFSNYGVDSITGVALVETINARLGLDLPTTVLFDYVSIEQLSRYIATSRGERLASSSRPADPPPAPAASPRQAEAAQPASEARWLSVRAVIRESIRGALKLDESQLDDEEAFSNYGVDSITGVALVETINAELGLSLPTTVLFDHVTIAQLSAHIVDAHQPSIAAAPAPESTLSTVPALSPMQSAAPAEAQLLSVRAVIRESIRGALKLDESQLDDEEAFSNYGVDSITGVALVETINARLDLDLPTTVLFDYVSIEQLSRHVASAYASRLRVPGTEPAPTPPRGPVPPAAAAAPAVRVAPIAPAVPPSSLEPIAVIGMSGRFGRAGNLRELWAALAGGEDLIEPVTRWDLSRHYADLGRPTCGEGSFLREVDRFDPLFFNISGAEARAMDPQQRLFLEDAWHALEDAGYAGKAIEGRRCGVYVGCTSGDYIRLLDGTAPPPQAFWGNAPSVIPARIAYHLNLQGAAVAVDTACSSSLVALHLACESLRSGEAELAIAGGVFVHSTEAFYVQSERAGMLSPTGRCHAFDASADGFVPGEGSGALILKPLSRAQADGDHIHAVIRASGTNQDGATNGITAPSARSQARLEKQVYERFGIDPDQIQLVEAHGTGTVLGDPIEFRALVDAFGPGTGRRERCALGTIKSNIGHPAAAAGIAGVIKLLLALRHRQIPASLHFEQGNPQIDFERSPFHVNTELKAWETPPGRERLAAISSFGFSGTNAHAVIAEAPRPAVAATPQRPAHLIVLSARSAAQLRTQVEQLLDHLRREPVELASVSFTLLTGRRHLEHRWACVADQHAGLQASLLGWLEQGRAAGVTSGAHRLDKAQALDLARLGRRCVGECLQAGTREQLGEALATLADLYTRGADLDWSELFAGQANRRASLPTYPFADERYWVRRDAVAPTAIVAARGADASEAAAETRQAPAAPLCFEERWQPVPLGAAHAASLGSLVLAGADPESVAALARLAPEAKVALLSLEELGDAAACANALRRVGVVDTLLWLGPLPVPSSAGDIAPLLHLLKAVGQDAVSCRRVVLAAQCRDDVHQAWLEALVGIERSLGLVLPDTRVTVAISRGREGVPALDPAAWLARLLAELSAGVGAGNDSAAAHSVLYLDDIRHQCRIVPVEPPRDGARPAFRRGGVYLITGGLGRLGGLVAGHLARRWGARLVLTGRGALDDTRRQRLATLRELGAEVLYLAADLADETAMRAARDEALRRFGRIDGVLHAAGLVETRSLLAKDAADVWRVLAPKLAGSRVLDAVLREQALDFICHFSSASAVLGDFGSADYAVGNRFQMALARLHRAAPDGATAAPQPASGQHRRVLAVGWPLWREGGMQVGDAGATRLYLDTSGQRVLETDEGLGLLDTLLADHALTHPLVIAGEPARIKGFLARIEAAPESAGNARASGTHPGPAQADAVRVSEPGQGYRASMKGLSVAECLAWDLAGQTAELMQIPREAISAHTNLAEYGFDSLALTEFARRLARHFSIELTPTLFYSHPSLGQFAAFLLASHGERLAAFYAAGGGIAALSTAPASRTSVALPPEPRVDVEAAAPLVPAPADAPRARDAAVRDDEPIAIIGMSGRFPGARNVDELWTILRDGLDMVRPLPAQGPADRPGAGDFTGHWLGELPGATEFDPLFFEIAPRDAELMDPRQRLLLQEAWRALENAGYGAAQLRRETVGMFVGVEQGSYGQLVGARGGVTSNHDGVLAARLAYALDLSGPTMAINTACSSGLVALHQACQSLRAGESSTAIAAGVNLMLAAEPLDAMRQAGMLSPRGKCRAFDRGADGMVPGEAAVALVLKPLSRAQADQDPIHGVIVGSGINYDGKTQGITAPSGAAQAQLLRDVYERHRIDPAGIDYVVAHGTGTVLGDPIEINALATAFRDYTQARGYCALSSTKSNLGHTLAPSGLVSVVALVQAMRHRTIPASLHCEQDSEHIDWESSPFYVSKASRPWPARHGAARLGAVSAFGVSGTNAHVVLRCADLPVASEVPAAEPARRGPFLLALSAKTPEALRERAEELRAALAEGGRDGASLHAASHTLLNGRLHFAYRGALVAHDLDEACDLLARWARGETGPNLFRGQVGREFVAHKALLAFGEQMIARVAAGADADADADNQATRDALYALADLYCQGYALPWEALFGARPPRRLALPAYPFARERYWLPAGLPGRQPAQQPVAPWLHPLVHRNTSALDEQRFSTTLSGEEFFLRDHLVQGRRVVPGVVQLEWARAAVALALGADALAPLRLEQVSWMRPIVVEGERELHIALSEDDSGRIGYEIYGDEPDPTGEANGEPQVYSQGWAIVDASTRDDDAPRLDLEALRARCVEAHDVEACYARFEAAGLLYGPSFRVLGELRSGEGIALGRLDASRRVGADVSDTRGFGWLPMLLDGALQSTLGLGWGDGRLALPFALESVSQWSALPEQGVAVVREAVDSGAGLRKWDIEIADQAGRVALRIGGVSTRAFDAGPAEQVRTLLFAPRWQAQALPAQDAPVRHALHAVVLAGGHASAALEHELAAGPDAPTILRLHAEGTLARRFGEHAGQLLAKLRDWLAAAEGGTVFVQLVVPAQGEDRALAGLGALLRSARQEYPQLVTQVLQVQAWDSLAPRLRAEAASTVPAAVMRDGTLGREVLAFEAFESFEDGSAGAGDETAADPRRHAPLPWRDGGVYWITGGLGGLGRVFAETLARSVREPVLVLSGRGTPTPGQEASLRALRELGARVDYRRVDVGDATAMAGLATDIVARHGALHGVIHAAGVLHDALLAHTRPEQLAQVLHPKVAGVQALDAATRDIALDWLLLCSSASSVLGNLGQAAYAAGNGFMDAYAAHREALAAAGERHGRTLSVSWPLWDEGGMQVAQAVRERSRQASGMHALPSSAGVAALHRALHHPASHLLVLHGDPARLGRHLHETWNVRLEAGAPVDREPAPLEAANPDALLEPAQRYLVGLLSRSLKLPPQRIDAQAPLEQYGIDSVLAITLTQDLEQVFGPLSKTLFFEYQTIAALTRYFLRQHATRLAALLDGGAQPARGAAPAQAG